jgi:hypothetical protein
VLGRWAEPAGLKFWSTVVSKHVPKPTIGNSIYGSNERKFLKTQGTAPKITLAKALADAAASERATHHATKAKAARQRSTHHR